MIGITRSVHNKTPAHRARSDAQPTRASPRPRCAGERHTATHHRSTPCATRRVSGTRCNSSKSRPASRGIAQHNRAATKTIHHRLDRGPDVACRRPFPIGSRGDAQQVFHCIHALAGSRRNDSVEPKDTQPCRARVLHPLASRSRWCAQTRPCGHPRRFATRVASGDRKNLHRL